MAILPCFVRDADFVLESVPGTELQPFGTLWLLAQGETRKTLRVRLLTEFIAARQGKHAARLAGQFPAN